MSRQPSEMPPPESMSTQGRRCLVIVPAYNEADSIRRVVEGLFRSLPDAHVLVVDDGSSDGTYSQVPSGAAVLRLPFNLGIGGAMQAGYRYAEFHGYDLAVQVDGDGQHPPDEVARLVAFFHASKADMVLGSRFAPPEVPPEASPEVPPPEASLDSSTKVHAFMRGNTPEYKQSLTRMAGIRMLNVWLRMLTGGRHIYDCTSGFRVVSRDLIRAFARWYPQDYPEPEVILLVLRAGYRIAEVRVRMEQRMAGTTSITLRRGIFYVVKVAVALVLDTMRQPYPTAGGMKS